MKGLKNLNGVWRANVPAVAMSLLVGCSMPNSSNPTLTIVGAGIRGDEAQLRMHLENPSDMDVRVNSIDWSLVYGPLPVADGSWDLGASLPSKGSYDFSRVIAFTTPAMDPDASEVELAGTIHVVTEGNEGNTALNEAGFVSSAKVDR